MRKCVTPGTLCPHAKKSDTSVAAIAHLSGPRTTKSAKTKRKQTKAPT